MAPMLPISPSLPKITIELYRFSPLILLLSIGIWGRPVQSQIVPDQTLGDESSVLVPGTNRNRQGHRIDGGAMRSGLLFHSFSEFNIDEAQGAYFSNPEGITDILSRVTGNSQSDILGTLGVLGNANLFLLNPNGIVFGPDSSLDVAGSFIATTADRFTFPDGSHFSAIEPNAAPLLNMTVPIGLQYGARRSGSIINAGNLEVGSEQALTLTGETVVNTGTLTAQGGQVAIASLTGPTNIQLNHQGHIQEIASLSDLLGPTLANAPTVPEILATTPVDLGLDLTADGQVAIASSGTIIPTASGDTIVSGDINTAHLGVGAVGGRALVLGDRVALVDDARLSVAGDGGGGTALIGGDYQGQGSLGAAQHTVIGSNSTINADAVTTGDGGRAIVWANDHTSFHGSISARGGEVSGNGGFVEVSGLATLDFQGQVDTTAKNGQFGTLLLDPTNILIVRTGGNAAVPDVDSFRDPNVGGNDPITGQPFIGSIINANVLEQQQGNVVVEASDNITIADGVSLEFARPAPETRFVGTGPCCSYAERSPAAFSPLTVSFKADADNNGVGNFSMDRTQSITALGRDIFIEGANVTAGQIDVGDFSVPTGNVESFNFGGLITIDLPEGRPAGQVSLQAKTGDLAVGNIITAANQDYPPLAGQAISDFSFQDAGAVTLEAPQGAVTFGDISAFASIAGYFSGSGGNIQITAAEQVQGGIIDARSDGGAGGDIVLRSLEAGDVSVGPLNVTGLNQSAAGSIGITTNRGDITTGDINALSLQFQDFGSNPGGLVNLTANGNISIGSINVQAPVSQQNDNSGAIFIDATEDLTIRRNASLLSSIGGGGGQGGNIVVKARSVNLAENASLNASTAGSGTSGNVLISTEALSLGQGARIQAETTNIGQSGDVEIRPRQGQQNLSINFQDDTSISVSTAGSGAGGMLNVSAPQSIVIAGNGELVADTVGAGKGGSVAINTQSLVIQDSAAVNTRSRVGATNGSGEIRINASQSFQLLRGSSLDAGTSSTGNGGQIVINTQDASNTINPDGLVVLNNGIIRAETEFAGVGGDVLINAGRVVLSNTSSISTSTRGSGNSGRIRISTTNQDPSTFAVSLENSNFSAIVDAGATGRGQNIELTTDSLLLSNGARIGTQSRGEGNTNSLTQAKAGDIDINVNRALRVSGSNNFGFNSGILTSSDTSTSGAGGNITINMPNSSRGTLTLSNNGFLAAGTRSDVGNGGNIRAYVQALNVEAGGQIITSTAGGGDAGQIEINATERVTIQGVGTAANAQTSLFDGVAVVPIQFNRQADPDNQTSVTTNPNYSTVSRGLGDASQFDYYSFEVSAADSRGIFDIDAGATPDATSIDTELFLYNQTTGQVLASNDDALSTAGAGGSTQDLDSFLDYTFASPGQYVIGVGAFNAFAADGSLISGEQPRTGQSYDLRVSLENQGTGNFDRADLNPNMDLESGILAEATVGNSNAGAIAINTPELIVSNNGKISAFTLAGSSQGIQLNDITSLDLTDATINSSAERGTAGNVSITMAGPEARITLNRSTIAAQANAEGGNAGDVVLAGVDQLSLDQSSEIAVSTLTGTAGDISINSTIAPAESIDVQGDSSINAQATGDDGNAGRISLGTRSLTLTNGQITASNRSGQSGDITVNRLNRLESNDGLITTSTESGIAGSIQIDATEGDNPAIVLSGISGSDGNRSNSIPTDGIIAGATDGGSAGAVSLTSPLVSVSEGARISTTVAGNIANASAGSVTVNARQLVLADPSSGIFAETTGAAKAGNLTVQPDQGRSLAIDFARGAQISAATSGTGDGGNLILNGRDVLDLQGNGRIRVSSTGTGAAGELQLNTDQLLLANGVELSAATISSDGSPVELLDLDQPLNLINTRITASTVDGNAGSLIIRAPSIRLSGVFSDENGLPILDEDNNVQPAGLFAEATGMGNAGFIAISTPGRFTVENGAQATISTEAGTGGALSIVADTISIQNPQQEMRTETGLFARSASGISGNITLSNIDTLMIQDGGQLSATTVSGRAGAINVNSLKPNASSEGASELAADLAPEAPATLIQIQGNNSVLSAQSELGGQAGNVILNVATLTVEDGGRLSASNVDSDTGGSVTLNELVTLAIRDGGTITAETQRGVAGRVTINIDNAPVERLTVSGEGSIITAEAQDGVAGSVQANAANIRVDQRGQITASSTSGQSEAVTLSNVETLRVLNGGQISVQTTTGVAGGVTINPNGDPADLVVVNGSANTDRSQISARANEIGGNAGQVRINAQRVRVGDGARITAANQSSSEADSNSSVRLQNVETLRVTEGSQISTRTQTGRAGDVVINQGDNPVRTLIVGDRSRITAQSTEDRGEAGSVRINAAQVTVRDRADITASNQDGASSGSVRLQNVETLRVTDEGKISAQTNTGTAGSVVINPGADASPADRVLVEGDRSRITAQARENGGEAGSVRINAARVTVGDRAVVTASNQDGDQGGNVRLQNVEALNVSTGGQVAARTNTGTAGSVLINPGADAPPAEHVRADGNRSQLSARAEEPGGDAGNVAINAQKIEVTNGAAVTASNISSNLSRDRAGSVRFTNVETLDMASGGQVTAQTQRGSAGNVEIDAQGGAIAVTTGGRITAETATGVAGNVEINTRTVEISDATTQISAQADDAGGNAGQVHLNAQIIQVSNDAQITASNVSGQTNRSNVRLETVERLSVTEGGAISTQTNQGQAGNVLINVDSPPVEQLTVQDARSQITAQARGGGNAGRVAIHAQELVVQHQGQITVQTETGTGGNIQLFGLDHAQIRDRGQITASTGTGRAGDINLQSRAVTVTDGGSITVRGDGPPASALGSPANRRGASPRTTNPQGGLAGNLQITANSLILDQGFLLATTGRNGDEQTGGNITINLGQAAFIDELDVNGLTHISNSLLLKDGDSTTNPGQGSIFSGALIEANATGAGVNAGEITITTGNAERIRQGGNVRAGDGFIIALMPRGDRGSDITTNADSGQGGVITLNTLGLLGIQVRDRLTSASDITSISGVDGNTGTITINDLGIDPSRGLTQLPIALVNAPPLEASCGVGSNHAIAQGTRQNEFVVTGRGGLPQQPSAPSLGQTILTPWVQRPTGAGNSSEHHRLSQNRRENSTEASLQMSTSTIEIQGWTTDDNGNIVLTTHPNSFSQPDPADGAAPGICHS